MRESKAEIISIGNEVLAGYTINTNATFISQQLLSIGFPVKWVTTISDEHDEILLALHTAHKRADAVLITGGLGPTPDDLTKKAICDYFKVGMQFHKEAWEKVADFLKSRNIPESEVNRAQAIIPICDEIIPNEAGTAPGLVFERDKHHFFFMPGVPGEMKLMVRKHILEYLKNHFEIPLMKTALLRTTGIPESRLYEKLKPLLEEQPHVQVSFLPRYIGVDLRFRLISSDPGDRRTFDALIGNVKEKVKKYIFSDRDQELEETVGALLIEQKLTLAVAESFTGGLLADLITNIPGSSQYFLAGLTTYSDQSKINSLSVSDKTIREFGAVSEETASEMVKGVQQKFDVDCAISTTGIAGPGGATKSKPVGLCYVAARYKDKETIKQFHFGNDRLINKKRGAVAGLEMLRRLILEQ